MGAFTIYALCTELYRILDIHLTKNTLSIFVWNAIFRVSKMKIWLHSSIHDGIASILEYLFLTVHRMCLNFCTTFKSKLCKVGNKNKKKKIHEQQSKLQTNLKIPFKLKQEFTTVFEKLLKRWNRLWNLCIATKWNAIQLQSNIMLTRNK